MKTRERILSQITGIPENKLSSAIIRADQALDAMEVYLTEYVPDSRIGVKCNLCSYTWRAKATKGEVIKCPMCKNHTEA